MPRDLAGNSLKASKNLGFLNSKSFKHNDFLNSRDRDDVLRFRVSASSRINLRVTGIRNRANVDLELYQLRGRRGKVIRKIGRSSFSQLTGRDLRGNLRRVARSARGGNRNEAINRTLNPGEYFILVKHRQGSTPYRLTGRTAAIAPPASSAGSAPSSLPADTARPFNIQFDYRFDTEGWFTPEKRAALEAAADAWERVILDDFPDVPAGTKTPFVINPQTGQQIREFITDYTIDDLVVFVGAQSLGGGIASTKLGRGGPSGWYRNEPRYTGAAFQPWIGSMTFNKSANWFFDPTPATANDIPARSSDFISTAAHELGHVLGFLGGTGGINAFGNLVEFKDSTTGRLFGGANAKSVNSGNSVPLHSDDSHILDGYELGGSGAPLMSPVALRGQRKLPTVLDLAILDDIGYTVNYSAAAQNPSAKASASRAAQAFNSTSGQGSTQRSLFTSSLSISSLSSPSSSLYASCGCCTCLMS